MRRALFAATLASPVAASVAMVLAAALGAFG